MRILITGASGQLGTYLIDELLDTTHTIIAWSGSTQGERSGIPFHPIDLTDTDHLHRSLDEVQPDAIIHAAAISAAEAVRLDPVRARSINVEATHQIARWAETHRKRLVFTSTDLVFDGSKSWNTEADPANPVLAYGRTKLDAESHVLTIPGGVVARICLLYGRTRCGRPSFFDRAIEAIRQGETATFFEDEFRTPLDLRSAASILIKLADSDQVGLFHVGGVERISRYELMSRASKALGLDASKIDRGLRQNVKLAEPRPADVSLDTSKIARAFPDWRRPTIEEALAC